MTIVLAPALGAPHDRRPRLVVAGELDSAGATRLGAQLEEQVSAPVLRVLRISGLHRVLLAAAP